MQSELETLSLQYRSGESRDVRNRNKTKATFERCYVMLIEIHQYEKAEYPSLIVIK